MAKGTYIMGHLITLQGSNPPFFRTLQVSDALIFKFKDKPLAIQVRYFSARVTRDCFPKCQVSLTL